MPPIQTLQERLEELAAWRRGKFITALAVGPEGQAWLGTEDGGVVCYDKRAPGGQQWRRFTSKDGLGDDNGYALAYDRKGRLWVGHLNHGVSVFNGQQWENYDTVTGPLGERVFAIAVCPTDGDVWIGTDVGLTRYSEANDSWSYYTRADGLPSDQIVALAFDKAGNLYAGTQCDGLAIAKADGGYRQWRVVGGPTRVTTSPQGPGLPSALINAVLVAHDGTVYVGTPWGLGWSKDAGVTWRYLRGAEWRDKVLGMYRGPVAANPAVTGDLLLEDYVTCLAEDGGGRLWIGHWRQGYEVWEPHSGKRVHSSRNDPGHKDVWDYVKAIEPWVPSRRLAWIGRYNDADTGWGGLSEVRPAGPMPAVASAQKPPAASPAPPLPTPAAPPTLAELDALQQKIATVQAPLKPNEGTYWGEDWVTQGDWVGRYGRQHNVMCAMMASLDHSTSWDNNYSSKAQMGPPGNSDDSLRGWVHTVKTANLRSLYDPIIGYRRQAEWDDHGESLAYPPTKEGPDIWILVKVPLGIQRISLYFYNKDGHTTTARCRDFLVEVKPYAAKIEEADAAPSLARARVRDFWGGVYKQFVVRGPQQFWIKIARNYSQNTIISGVFIDKLTGPPTESDSKPLGFLGGISYAPPQPDPSVEGGTHQDPILQSAVRVWAGISNLYGQRDGAALQRPCRLLAYRAALGVNAPEKLLANWRWTLCHWTAGDRRQFQEVMAEGWYNQVRLTPNIATP